MGVKQNDQTPWSEVEWTFVDARPLPALLQHQVQNQPLDQRRQRKFDPALRLQAMPPPIQARDRDAIWQRDAKFWRLIPRTC